MQAIDAGDYSFAIQYADWEQKHVQFYGQNPHRLAYDAGCCAGLALDVTGTAVAGLKLGVAAEGAGVGAGACGEPSTRG